MQLRAQLNNDDKKSESQHKENELIEAATKGHVESQINLGNFYFREQNITNNAAKAYEWFEKAAAKNNSQGQYSLGVCYQIGIGVDRDYKKAFEYFQKAVKQNLKEAPMAIGIYYELGIVVEKNEVHAISFYQKGAYQGHAPAQWKLACSLLKGNPTSEQRAIAAYWIQSSAKLGFPCAQSYINNKISFNANFIIEQALVSNNCFVPVDIPCGIPQFGPICGILAFVNAANYSKQRQKRLYVSEYDKSAMSKNVNKNDNIVLYQFLHYINFQIKEKWRSKNGEIYHAEIFLKLADHFGIKGCEVIIKDNYSLPEYEKTLIEQLRNNKVLIIACEAKFFMPVQNQGKSTHWVFVPAYWYKKDNTPCIGVVDDSIICEWELENHFNAIKKVPIDNPNKSGGHLKKFRFSIFSMPVAKDHSRKIIDHQPVASLDTTVKSLQKI